MVERVGSATVEVNADLRKLLDGLDKAKRAAADYVQTASRTFATVTAATRTASQGMQAFAERSQTATSAIRLFGAATQRTSTAVASATAGMRAYTASTPAVTQAMTGVRTAAAGMTATVAAATVGLTAAVNRSPAASSALKGIGAAFAGITAGVMAAGAAFLAYANRSPILSRAVAGLGIAAAGLATGFAAVAARAGPALSAAWRFVNHPLGIFTLSALAGSPVLGAGLAIASTRAGPAIGRGLLVGGAFAMRSPLAALGIGGGAALAGIAGIGALASTIGGGFSSMAEGFRDARKSAADLKTQLEALKTSAEKMTEELPEGSGLRAARERALRGITGGLTSQFAFENRGLIRSEVILQSSDAIEEFTLRLGSARQAATLLAQALRNPERAMALLSDVGIRFTETERKILERTQTLEDRLRNAGIVIEAVNRQLGRGPDTTSGWQQFMYQVGQFLGTAPGAVWQAIVEGIKGAVNELLRLTGLTSAVTALDDAFKSLAATMRSLNIRLFGGDPRTEIEVLRKSVEDLDRQLAEHRRALQGPLNENPLARALGLRGTREFHERNIAALERQRTADLSRLGQVSDEEEDRRNVERDEQARRSNERLSERLRLLHAERDLLEGAGNRSELEARRLAALEGIGEGHPRFREFVEAFERIEAARRRIAQAGQLTVFERENTRLEHQIQLFRFGNQEMEIRNRLLQIEIAAAQRRQPLTREQSQQLLNQLRIQREIKHITDTIESAFSATFNAMADAIAQFASTGKFKFKDMADSIVQQLVRIGIQAMVIRPLLNAITGFFNPMVGNLFSPGSMVNDINVPRAGGYAEGGSFTIPGGRTGDQPYLIGLSAGERVDVTPAKGRGGGGEVTINNIVNSSREMEVESRERQAPDGSRIIDQVFTEVSKRIGRGDMDTTFGARFGMRPRSIQR